MDGEERLNQPESDDRNLGSRELRNFSHIRDREDTPCSSPHHKRVGRKFQANHNMNWYMGKRDQCRFVRRPSPDRCMKRRKNYSSNWCQSGNRMKTAFANLEERRPDNARRRGRRRTCPEGLRGNIDLRGKYRSHQRSVDHKTYLSGLKRTSVWPLVNTSRCIRSQDRNRRKAGSANI